MRTPEPYRAGHRAGPPPRRPDRPRRRVPIGRAWILAPLLVGAVGAGLFFAAWSYQQSSVELDLTAAPPAGLGTPGRDDPCAATVRLGEAAVAAATDSAASWRGHVQAQLDFDRGALTRAQTRERWAATRVGGEEGVERFRVQESAYRASEDACRTALAGSPGAGPDVVACAERWDAVDATVRAGTAVVDDWAHHLEMMAQKAEMDPSDYGRMWRTMVDAAPAALDAFAAASDRAGSAPACPRG